MLRTNHSRNIDTKQWKWYIYIYFKSNCNLFL